MHANVLQQFHSSRYITASLFVPCADAKCAEVKHPLSVVIFLHGFSYQLGWAGIYGLYEGDDTGLINGLVQSLGVAVRSIMVLYRQTVLRMIGRVRAAAGGGGGGGGCVAVRCHNFNTKINRMRFLPCFSLSQIRAWLTIYCFSSRCWLLICLGLGRVKRREQPTSTVATPHQAFSGPWWARSRLL